MDVFKAINAPLEDLSLSVRTYNCLKRAGIDTVFDVLRSGPAALIRVRNIGRKSLGEIWQKLDETGFSLAFQLAVPSLCGIVAARMRAMILTDAVTFLTELLGELGCPTDTVPDAYAAYCEKGGTLGLEDHLAQFVLLCYYGSKDSGQPDAPEPEDEAEDDEAFYEPDHEETYFTIEDTPDEPEISARPAALAALERMTGLRHVKAMIADISAHCVIAKMKHEAGAADQVFVPNAVFLGNPGTGKTTVAKIVAQLYQEIGLLERGHLVTAEQADLIGKYVGHTAPLVKEVFTAALGGVLFIDEAYMLGENHDYGKQAAATLTNLMTEHRGQCCVILAGYEERMNRMMRETNPGLRERFPFKLQFEDYSADELMEIFMRKLEESKLRISPQGRQVVAGTLSRLFETRSGTFANAREAENLFQQIVLQQERRLFLTREKAGTLSPRMLFHLTKSDCALAHAHVMAAHQPLEPKRRIGFAG